MTIYYIRDAENIQTYTHWRPVALLRYADSKNLISLRMRPAQADQGLFCPITEELDTVE